MTLSFTERWEDLWQRLGQPAPGGLLEALLAAYREPQRHYHTLQHLAECFAHLDAYFDSVGAPAGDVLDIELALWFHDAVYDVRAHDNEARSADWAVRALAQAGLPPARGERVASLVMATAHHAPAAAADAQLLIDIDLAILGAPPARFAEYERQIRAEYAHVPAPLFARKRGEVLRGFLDRDRIYRTAYFARLEQQARANLAQASAVP